MDSASLLCESCGYGLEGLPVSGNCPECGRPIAESLPSQRTGTAWQRSPGLFSWALTCKRVLVGPAHEFSRVSMSRACPGLLLFNLLIAGTIFAAPWTGVFVGDPVRTAHGRGPVIETLALAAMVIIEPLIAAAILLLLTLVIELILRFYGRTRGWRLTRRCSWQVISHASAAWIVAAALPLLMLAVWYTFGTLLKLPIPGSVPGRPVGMQVSWQSVLGGLLPALGFAAGFTLFLSRLWIGAKACRFAADPLPLSVSAA